jgi:apolipoprotein N-acyltransferase
MVSPMSHSLTSQRVRLCANLLWSDLAGQGSSPSVSGSPASTLAPSLLGSPGSPADRQPVRCSFAGWGTCEFARANLLIGNPWALSGYSQVAWTQIIQIADTTGPYGVGMLIAAVNACVAGVLSPALRSRRPVVSGAGVAAALCVTLFYGQWRLSQPFATGEPVTVAVIQGAIERQNGQNTEQQEIRLQRYLALTKEAAAAHPSSYLLARVRRGLPSAQRIA